MSQTVLVTGGTGYLGASLVKQLLLEGFDVGVLVRKGSSLKLLDNCLSEVKLLEYYGDNYSLDEWFSFHKPVAVFHLASLFLVNHESSQIPALIQSNIQLGTQLAEACIKHGCSNFINTGTSWQGITSMEYQPVNIYAATKNAFENILFYYSQSLGLRVVTLRLFDTYGPNDPRQKIIQLLIGIAKSGAELNLSPGEQRLNLVHIKDVVQCFITAYKWINIQDPSTNNIFGVYDDIDYSLKEIASLIENIIQRKLNLNFGFLPYREREVMMPAEGYSQLPGWHPIINLRDGLAELL